MHLELRVCVCKRENDCCGERERLTVVVRESQREAE